MKKEEILLNEPEIVETKPNKVKIALSILASTLVVATITTLLVGHFKFDWFKSDEYKIDARINRSIYQANYFSEKKTITTKFNFEDGHAEEKEYIVDNNFVAFITDKSDNINTATLVLLSATATVDDQIKELAHLDMFDDEQRKDLESNPDGAKYPMAVFKFTDDGDIQEIDLPDNMDKYNAESFLEVIKKIIPKLTRNKKEDMSNGLEITTKKVNNKRIIVQNEAPKQYQEFKGSRYTKVVKTEKEDDQITNIESNDNLYMESKPEGDEFIYGPKDFTYDVKSEITTNEVKFNEKENVELIKKLSEKFNFVESEILLQKITDSELKKNAQKVIVEEEKVEETKPVRNLFSISASKTFNLASFNVLGQTVSVKYVVGISGNTAYNKIVISSGLGSFEFGNQGCSGSISYSKSYSQPIFVFVVPPFPAVSVGCYVGGSVYVGFGFQSGSGSGAKYWAKASGSLTLGAEIKAGWDVIASLSAYAEGTVISAQGQVILSQGSVSKDSGFSLSIGRLVVGIRGVALGVFRSDLWSTTLFNGWSL